MPSRGDSGFTLLESVVALSIVGVVAIAVLASLGAEMRAAARAREALPAAALAESRLEALRLLPSEALRSLPDSVRQGRFPAPLESYSWSTTVAPVPAEPGLYGVEVLVEWPGGDYLLRGRLHRPAAGM
jgi:type II secretion system protein I